MSDFTKKIEEESKNLFPCESPCDSYGICDNCSHAKSFTAGAKKALEILASVDPEKDTIIGCPTCGDEWADGRFIPIEALASLSAKLELANAEIESLKSMRSKDQNVIEAKDHEIVMLKSENNKLTEQLSDFKKCVEFYGDKAKMNHGITFAEDGGGFIGYINEDDFELITSNDPKLDYFVSGKLARATLNKYKSSKEQGMK